MNNSSSFVAVLNDLAVIEIAGADAASFLHSQLTHDITGLTPNTARLAGYCTAKGRLLGSLIIWQTHTDQTPVLYALVKTDVAQALVKRLSMYILRSKATLTITDLSVLGVQIQTNSNLGLTPPSHSQNEASTLGGLDIDALEQHPSPWTVMHDIQGTWIAAPSANSANTRWWLATNANQPKPIANQKNAHNTAAWQAADIAAGLPWIVAHTQDIFIPQTLNLDLIDGVSFTKGCYPGQEVVARSHYRGTVKRRMAYGISEQAPHVSPTDLPGTDIFDANKPENPCGRVINAAQTDNQVHLLLEIQLSDLNTADFRIGQANGATITLQALPYEISVATQ